MVLVRRRSDGLYYTNRGRGEWVNDPSLCKPYVNERGARWSFHYYMPRSNECDHFKLIPSVWGSGPYRQWDKNCACEKKRKEAVRKAFDDNYEVIPVQMKVTPL